MKQIRYQWNVILQIRILSNSALQNFEKFLQPEDAIERDSHDSCDFGVGTDPTSETKKSDNSEKSERNLDRCELRDRFERSNERADATRCESKESDRQAKALQALQAEEKYGNQTWKDHQRHATAASAASFREDRPHRPDRPDHRPDHRPDRGHHLGEPGEVGEAKANGSNVSDLDIDTDNPVGLLHPVVIPEYSRITSQWYQWYLISNI